MTVTGLLVFLYVALALPKSACAYIDPGSISVLLQLVFTSAAGFLFAFRRIILNFFLKLFRRHRKDEK